MKYIVKPGDNLSTIGAQYGMPYQKITGYKSKNPDLIFPGEELDIPDQPAQLPEINLPQTGTSSATITPTATPTPTPVKPVNLEDPNTMLAQVKGTTPAQLPEISLPKTGTSDLSKIGVPDQYIPIIEKAATDSGVPAKILAAIAKHESASTFDPKIKQYGFGLGRGMFQIDLGQHPNVTEEQAFDPQFSANYAAGLLADAYARYGNWDDAIKAYNAGNPYSTARGYNGQPVYQLANQYLAAIQSAMGG
jgi:LysM repeat protein